MTPARPYQVCGRCVMDTTVPEIRFDEQGMCQFCEIHNLLNMQKIARRHKATRWRGLAERLRIR